MTEGTSPFSGNGLQLGQSDMESDAEQPPAGPSTGSPISERRSKPQGAMHGAAAAAVGEVQMGAEQKQLSRSSQLRLLRNLTFGR